MACSPVAHFEEAVFAPTSKMLGPQRQPTHPKRRALFETWGFRTSDSVSGVPFYYVYYIHQQRTFTRLQGNQALG